MNMRVKWIAVSIALGLLGGCADIPRDASGTLDSVRSRAVLRVGLVPNHSPAENERQSRFAEHIAREAGGSPQLSRGSSEELLTKLETGGLDLVVGSFASDSPWKGRVAFVPDSPRGKDRPTFGAAAVRNGENAWLAFIHRRVGVLEGGR
jgi:hypothetical protein